MIYAEASPNEDYSFVYSINLHRSGVNPTLEKVYPGGKHHENMIQIIDHFEELFPFSYRITPIYLE
jgi:hypothetical protein